MDHAAAQKAFRKCLSEPQRFPVIAVKGPWGSGKTHLWLETEKWLKEAAGEPNTRAGIYCSLFGLNSVEDIRKSLLTSMMDESAPTLSTAGKVMGALGTGLFEFVGTYVPGVGAAAKVGASAMTALTDVYTNKHLAGRRIILDDMERRGGLLTIVAILGLIDFLRGAGAQVVVLFNDERIRDDASKELKTFREKAFNVELEVRPSVQEAFDIAYGKSSFAFEKELRQAYVRFGITNIRVAERIVEAAGHIFAGQEPSTGFGAIVKETMPAIVVATGLFYEALPGWPLLAEVVETLLSRGEEQTNNRHREPVYPPEDMLASYLGKVEPEFFSLVALHVSTGALVETELRHYWMRRRVREEADELHKSIFWSPVISVDQIIDSGDALMKKIEYLDGRRLGKLSNGFSHRGITYLEKIASDAEERFYTKLAMSRIKPVAPPVQLEEHDFRGLLELKKALLDATDKRFYLSADIYDAVQRATREDFEFVFGSDERDVFWLGVLFLKAWLDEVDENWNGPIGQALRYVLDRPDADRRYAIFYRELAIDGESRGMSTLRFPQLLRGTRWSFESAPIPTAP
ncbi:P-loop NTPase fold protein [Cupriavidus pampae]|uniref:KAP NTPase domain-containing protein n=1 Tax=Cupriavidus pampae TaxID=659251 RepID=A0ABN7YC73_9BURK|nr:P-loop NTPase fold protein [Cupriavidus pampae]CAG9171028.1 hypothetical protein LMG32289_02231 [Cupriavidus pampae]